VAGAKRGVAAVKLCATPTRYLEYIQRDEGTVEGGMGAPGKKISRRKKRRLRRKTSKKKRDSSEGKGEKYGASGISVNQGDLSEIGVCQSIIIVLIKSTRGGLGDVVSRGRGGGATTFGRVLLWGEVQPLAGGLMFLMKEGVKWWKEKGRVGEPLRRLGLGGSDSRRGQC